VLKWKLMLTTLPFVAAVVGLKLVLVYLVHWDGVIEFADIGIVLTGGVFLVGFMLGGTMADYKESEKLPGELACQLEALEEQCVQGAATKNLAAQPLRHGVLALTDAIRDWLYKKKSQAQMYQALNTFQAMMIDLEKGGAGGYAAKAVGELHTLRKLVTRIGVISRTGFLPPAYALLDTLVVIIIGLVECTRYKTPLAMGILVPFIALIYIYMVRLIRDIDDPFDYQTDGSHGGGAEVEMFPVEEYRERLAARAHAAATPDRASSAA
jgi:hypothetical protein